MGPEVNTKVYHEAAPVISTDGKKLFFFINNHPSNTYGKDNSQDIWVTNLDDKGNWSEAKRMGPPLNENRYNQVYNVYQMVRFSLEAEKVKTQKVFNCKSFRRLVRAPDQGFEKMDKGTFNGATIRPMQNM